MIGGDNVALILVCDEQIVHRKQGLGTLLEVRVHEGKVVSCGLLQAGQHRGLLPEVARERDNHCVGHAPVCLNCLKRVGGVVGGAVVHEDELEAKPLA